ncbi:MAG: class I SAM-dependent methyltransferase [Pseudomonadota bacterium]|jgi:SAM-dependent methyltransferase|uniref:SAM-dependent methyltransferase n=1 Tax=Brevundimonas aurantiaca TaxID=74316 RepID=A0A7W9F7I9_9CAUL|nr:MULTISPECIES: class I SAM-dependent methyltransferase [Brevundimonas]MEC8456709.1 class I SAM-dependent methyltransferase [Pseudomonadota bacterium]MBB5739106.1 SAM-dependent methyltransferase [Brevundimonas aurantiaca]MBJ7509759.1 class I SAM-dependent methyltransferase [Brevundimonas sp.]MBJ7509798.1 class I SAM-dependent methyltransferase [Brevundimonas sp.]MCC4294506.1 class I SAM-dependent methyltransferase [Brevundimonas aurantiaca]
MSHPAADRVIGLYQDGAEGWIADRGPSLYAGPNGPNEAEWLDRFVADLPSNARLLDVGCGSGWPIGAALLARGFRVVGRDSSPALIAHARQTLPSGVWEIADMRNPPPDGMFDGVLAWHSLFHLTPDDQLRVLPALANQVGPGGRLMFTSGPAHGETIGEWRGEPLYHGSLDPAAYRALLAEAGLSMEADGAETGVWLARRAILSAK